jgi:hypothetical protein
MPHGARTSLAALILLLGLGAVGAEPAPGTTWRDPPAHKPAAEAPAPDRTAAPAPAAAPAPSQATASAPSTPAAAPEARPTHAARKADARKTAERKTAERRASARTATRATAPKRVAAAAHRSRGAAAAPRVIADPRIAAAPPPEGYVRYRPYGRPYGSGPGYGPGYADERFDRLSSAEAAGYLVVRRRTVLFPDGRALRVYRPDDGEPF